MYERALNARTAEKTGPAVDEQGLQRPYRRKKEVQRSMSRGFNARNPEKVDPMVNEQTLNARTAEKTNPTVNRKGFAFYSYFTISVPPFLP